jgi:hypothetical protein
MAGKGMTKRFAVLIVGRGKLAQELLQGLRGPAISRVIPWEGRDSLDGERCMAVHAGSGRELGDVIAFCAATGSVLLDLSTAGSEFPAALTFPVVVCPNVNMLMLSFMAMVKQASTLFQGRDITITESHQASKRTSPGTAIHLATSLGLSADEIRSERKPQVQREVLGIPPEHLDRHAYHEIVIGGPEAQIRLETRVLGKAPYATGLAKVIELVCAREPAPGLHDIVDLVMDEGIRKA